MRAAGASSTGCCTATRPDARGATCPSGTVPGRPSRQRRWRREGLWRRILAALQRELADAGRIDWTLWCVEGSHVRAYRYTAGAGRTPAPGKPPDYAPTRGRGRFTTKLHLTDGRGGPLAVALSAGQAYESVHATRVLDTVREPRVRRGGHAGGPRRSPAPGP